MTRRRFWGTRLALRPSYISSLSATTDARSEMPALLDSLSSAAEHPRDAGLDQPGPVRNVVPNGAPLARRDDLAVQPDPVQYRLNCPGRGTLTKSPVEVNDFVTIASWHMPAGRPTGARRILVIRLSALGDFVQSLGPMTALRHDNAADPSRPADAFAGICCATVSWSIGAGEALYS
jgi:hypothetical protein